MSDDLDANVMRVLCDVLGVSVSHLNPQTVKDDIETWDSVAIVNLVAALEVELGVSIPIDDAAELTSVARVLSIVKSHRAH